MPDYVALKAELTNDPTDLGLVAASHAVAATLLNGATVQVVTERSIVPSYEVFEAIDAAEWTSLSAAEKQRVQTILSMGSVNVRGTQTRGSMAAAFGAGTTTRTRLLALENETVARSRALVIFGAAPISEHDVAHARSL